MQNIEFRINELIGAMTLAEKCRMCHAVSRFTSGDVERLNIPGLSMSDGPHGVREELAKDSWDSACRDDDFVTYLPTGTALAATWNRKCAERFGQVLGAEAKARGKNIILGPGINLIRSPLCGRNFEYYGEDPCQVGELCAAAIQGIQSRGVAACVKHFALNSQELARTQVDAECCERTLRELYLPAFEKAVRKGKAWSVMGAYNLFRGQYCCQNDYLLNQVLKKEWHFDGVVISDWNGVHDTYQAANCGMDLEMGTARPYEEYYLAGPMREAVMQGAVDETLVDDKVRRILRLMFRTGLLGDKQYPPGVLNTSEHQAAAREIAEEAAVLLKNESRLLPLNKNRIRKLLVVGDNATRRHHLGGNSSAVKALYEFTPLEGIREYLKGFGCEVEYRRGYPNKSGGETIPSHLMSIVDPGSGTRGWIFEFYDKHENGRLLKTEYHDLPEFAPDDDLPPGVSPQLFGLTVKGRLTVQESGLFSMILDGCSQAVLTVNNQMVIPNCKGRENLTGTTDVMLEAGKTYELAIHVHRYIDMPVFPVRLTWRPADMPMTDDAALLQAAAGADAVLFFGGLNHTYDVEGTDRKDMALHDGQNELIRSIARVNSNLVAVLVGGSPVEMPWAEQVAAIVQMWYAGMEGGNAIARLLFGEVNFSGKLPFTFPKRLSDSPAHALDDYRADTCYYREGVMMGYRWFDSRDIAPEFCFGHGLSYTEFEYSEPKFDPASNCAKITVSNTGERSGKEVIQLYVAPPASKIVRPKHELKGFAKIELSPGRSEVVEFPLDHASFSHYDPVLREWKAVPGIYTLEFAASSRDIRCSLPIGLSDEQQLFSIETNDFI